MSRVHTILPMSQKESYGSAGSELIDLKLEKNGNRLLNDNIYISGQVEFFKSAGVPFAADGTDDVYFDSDTGMHSLIMAISESFSELGQLPPFNNYPRWAKHYLTNSVSKATLASQSDYSLALCCSDTTQTRLLVPGPDPVKGFTKYSFCFKPIISTNLMTAPLKDNLGQHKITLTLNDPMAVLWGKDVTTASGYKITNLELHYTTVPEDGSPSAKFLPVVSDATHTVNSSIDSFSINMATVSNSVVGSFLPVEEYNSPSYNALRFANPKVSRLVWSFNDATNQIIGYNLESQEEILFNALAAMGQRDNTLYNLPTLNGQESDNFQIGINFGRLLNLKNQKIGVQTTTELATTANRYFLYLFFMGQITL